jgi:hypothetical protein
VKLLRCSCVFHVPSRLPLLVREKELSQLVTSLAQRKKTKDADTLVTRRTSQLVNTAEPLILAIVFLGVDPKRQPLEASGMLLISGFALPIAPYTVSEQERRAAVLPAASRERC